MREPAQRYIPGDYWMVCDECGCKFRSSRMRLRYDGSYVCRNDWEPRHPQEDVRGRVDKIVVPVARPDAYSEGTTLVSGTPLTDTTPLDQSGSYITTPVTQDDL